MRKITVYHYDAFSKKAGKGNPAGVVLNGEQLTDEEMQETALKVGFNETAFPLPSDVADLRIRFFTPGHEMKLCGHATIATVYALKTKGLLADKTEWTIETNAGTLPVSLHTMDNDLLLTMQQASPAFNGSVKNLANSIGLNENEIREDIPVVYGSTGTWTLLIPIKELASFQKMKPDTKRFPAILQENTRASVHPFCMETIDPEADMHARHFSSPYSGTVEDAVTGTASGVMGAYYATYMNPDFAGSLQLLVEQGHEVGKDGRVLVDVSRKKEICEIMISGNAVFVKAFDVVLDE
ncbi:PhzF family phenazine biosynthesis protein [Gracilibacillus caseinilyticus]|uniref:PhzF family phenazine biosynthesis protein n=1 Tax=Gracilibacillus caseinilyticus TaxID=2932256 RepID=A0ABY4F107_9BACI|nr:PhzF family phenazine biosynthesis protein [Gracilibacillus caseinilyticus]UOQ50164.1 PhzF family phenazine biosynthesis protein [Gracilibacillus caseinilyticus]